MDKSKLIDTVGIAALMGISLARAQALLLSRRSDPNAPQPVGKFSELGRKSRFYFDRKAVEDWIKTRDETQRSDNQQIIQKLDNQLVSQFIRGHFDRQSLRDKHQLKRMNLKFSQPERTTIHIEGEVYK